DQGPAPLGQGRNGAGGLDERQTRSLRQRLQRGHRARAPVGDDFGGGQRAQLAGVLQRQTARQTQQHARRVFIPGAGGVDHLVDRDSGDIDPLIAGQEHRAGGPARDGGHLDHGGQAGGASVEIIRLEQGGQFAFIGQDDVGRGLDEGQQLGAPAGDDEGVGQGDGHLAPGGVSGGGGGLEGGAGGGR